MSGRPRTTSFAEGKTQPNPVMGGMKISSKYSVHIKKFLTKYLLVKGFFKFFCGRPSFQRPSYNMAVFKHFLRNIRFNLLLKLRIHCSGRQSMVYNY